MEDFDIFAWLRSRCRCIEDDCECMALGTVDMTEGWFYCEPCTRGEHTYLPDEEEIETLE